MAAMSAAQATSTLTPPSSSHGNGFPWDVSSTSHQEQTHSPEKRATRKDSSHSASRSPFLPQNGNSAAYNAGTGLDASSKKSNGTDLAASSKEPGYSSAPHGLEGNQGSINEAAGPADSLLEIYGSSRSVPSGAKPRRTKEIHGDTYEFDDESSKWIHRDKLARIESEELQAAGIILPKARARSKPRREQSSEKINGHRKHAEGGEHTRSRKNSTITTTEPKTPETPVPSWDLRLPEEIEAEGDGYWISIPGTNGSSKIPIAKTSPVPIPLEQLERDTPMTRKRDHSPSEDKISMPKARRARSGSLKALDLTATPTITQPKRSATDVSPKKSAGTPATRKSSAPAKANNQTGRPKTRGGPSTNNGSNGNGTRPSTRSGERELSGAFSAKQPEGDPPWMVSAYRPDPRLPPDQQLLPTVARRLQQEKWEKEGKFGNVYDKEFRPLTDEGFRDPPEPDPNAVSKQEDEQPDEWPLKTEARSPTLMPPNRTNSYSTIPKIQEKPNMSPLASPRTPVQQGHPSPVVRAPEPQEEEEQQQKEKSGCGCCIVM